MTTATIKKQYRPRYVYGHNALMVLGQRQAKATRHAWENAKTRPQKIAAGISMGFLMMPTVLFVGIVLHDLVWRPFFGN